MMPWPTIPQRKYLHGQYMHRGDQRLQAPRPVRGGFSVSLSPAIQIRTPAGLTMEKSQGEGND